MKLKELTQGDIFTLKQDSENAYELECIFENNGKFYYLIKIAYSKSETGSWLMNGEHEVFVMPF